MSLQQEIDERAREISTDSYSMSVNEAAAMYEQGDLEVHPEFQRIFRWTLHQQSRLVESILIGIPIPPIFVAVRSDGIWDVVDGVQRLSTIFRFMGILKDENNSPDPAMPLVEGDYLHRLRGVVWDDDVPLYEGAEPLASFDDVQRRFFKRARLDFQIVEKESDDSAKFDLFQRLNSGTHLSDQEARNCLAVMLDSSFSRWLANLAADQNYDSTLAISLRQEEESYDVESVLRFLAIVNTEEANLRSMGHFGEFLTSRMRDFISDGDFDRRVEEHRFRSVFKMINESLGDRSFRRYDEQRDDFLGKVSISAFEAISSGLAYSCDAWERFDGDRGVEIERRVKQVWTDSLFRERSGGGKPANRRIPYMVEVGRRIFSLD